MKRRVSDPSWTTEERIEVIGAFLDRADEALRGPLFEDEDLSDPNGGVRMPFVLSFDPRSGEQKIQFTHLVLTNAEYGNYIRLLRPFILKSEEVFLPKVARHARLLLKPGHERAGDNLVNWVEGQVSFEKEFHPNHFYTYVSKGDDGPQELAASSADIALDYIYGRSVKVDLDKRRELNAFEEVGMFDVSSSLNAYLKQLMRVVLTVTRDIRKWNGNDWLMAHI